MKILWLCNTLIPEAADFAGIKTSKPESWISGLYNDLKGNQDINLTVMFPQKGGNLPDFNVDGTRFIAYPQKNAYSYEKEQESFFEKQITDIKPDVIHIFGTEYPHSLAMLKACKRCGIADRAVLNIQGLCSVIARHYISDIPRKYIHRYTLRDILKRDSIYRQSEKFKRRGKYEEKAITLASHIIGRTDWDRACVTRINPNVEYHFCNETLRPAFYNKKWEYENCEKNSIFVSQCGYALKGFHYMLEAMTDIIKKYPDAHIYTVGTNPLTLGLKGKLRQTYYNRYIGKLIKKYRLQGHITFLGFLKEEKMCEQYLKSNVFVCCSSIENSSNSVGEAMMLGTPVAASDVGGMKNIITHGTEGYIYQHNAPYMLGYYVCELFSDTDKTKKFSENAKLHALTTHDRNKNTENLISIYNCIAKNDKKGGINE